MNIKLKYGSEYRVLELPDDSDVTIMKPRDMPVLEDLGRALDEALDHPIDTPPLEGRARPESIAIAVPDETRPA
ncbi:MAG: transcriptional regulator, partial [Deltaproteobacteria bacterium HGW-Deltaproteobacteria-20]